MTADNWGPLIGVVVGFALGQIAAVVSWLVSERREKKLTRALISLEIDQNLGLLRDYWRNVALPSDEDAPPEERDEIEAVRLARRGGRTTDSCSERQSVHCSDERDPEGFL